MGGVACNFGLMVYTFKFLFQAHKMYAQLLCSSACTVKERKHRKRAWYFIILISMYFTLEDIHRRTRCLLETKELNKQTAYIAKIVENKVLDQGKSHRPPGYQHILMIRN